MLEHLEKVKCDPLAEGIQTFGESCCMNESTDTFLRRVSHLGLDDLLQRLRVFIEEESFL